MINFDETFRGFIFSTLGIILGWTLNQLGQWANIRYEEKKNLKIVLFNLLETYFLFVRSDFEKFSKRISKALASKIPEADRTADFEKIIRTLFIEITKNHIKPNHSREVTIVQENYKKSIMTLASIYPLTAYYLNDKTNILETFDKIDLVLNNFINQFAIEVNTDQTQYDNFRETIKLEFHSETLDELERDILKVTPFVWFKTILAIKSLKKNTGAKQDEEIERLLNKFNFSNEPN